MTRPWVPAKPGLDDQTLRQLAGWLADHRDDMLDDLAAYVAHETPSNDKALLDAGLDWIRSWMAERLAAQPQVRRCAADGDEFGDVLLLDFAATNGGSDRPVLWLCHYDTVWDAGTLAGWPFDVHDGLAVGPGAFDMKAGLVQGVWALAALEALDLPRPALRVLLNGDEEVGSLGSRSIIESSAEDVAAVMVLEPAAEGAVKTSRKGVGIFELETLGVEAHAGLDPTAGASAVSALARLVLAASELQDLGAGTSVNIGTFHGGTRTNVVAGHARAMVDVRVTSASEACRIEEGLAALVENPPIDSRVKVVFGGGWNRPVMERTEAIGIMYDLARRVAEGIGFDLAQIAAGGGSDGNFLAHLPLPLLDGLGPTGSGAHSRNEQVEIDQLPVRAALIAGLVNAFTKRSQP